MSKTTFTKGPWKVFQISGWEFSIDAGGTVARITQKIDFPTDEGGTTQGRSENRMKADANLIAAAPEMYEILSEMVEASEECGQTDRPMVVVAREILAKARGES